jgi:2-amino-4-hydroxy-6-hydroxymethyldihydropteridine diphosphokinase
MTPPVHAYLALGANIGNRIANMRAAVRAMGDAGEVAGVSSLYESPAMVQAGARPGPEFLNAACEIVTPLDAQSLLAFIKRVEHALGRRPARRWAARPIDVDILLYGDAVVDTPDLTIPHPRMAERSFVLVPLAEIAPAVVHPVLAKRIADIAAGAGAAGLTRVAGSEWVT